MPDNDTPTTPETSPAGAGEPLTSTAASESAASVEPAAPPARRRRAAQRPAGPPAATFAAPDAPESPAAPAAAPLTTSAAEAATPLFQPPEVTAPPRRRRKTTSASAGDSSDSGGGAGADSTEPARDKAAADTPAKKAPAKRAGAKKAPPSKAVATTSAADEPTGGESGDDAGSDKPADQQNADAQSDDSQSDAGADGESGPRKRRRRGGRGRRKPTAGEVADDSDTDGETDGSSERPIDAAKAEAALPTDGETSAVGSAQDQDKTDGGDSGEPGSSTSSRRRRRRRRKTDTTEGGEQRTDDPDETVVRVRETRRSDNQITATKGSTRVEAKRQRRRDGRDSGRRRPSIMSESEFLARRESVERLMVVRQKGERDDVITQLAVLEDGMLVEHYVDQGTQRSIIGNIYLGKVQNVLPAMEAAFIDIGRGRNAVLYAGEVDWSKAEGKPKRIEEALTPGQSVLVQVTKDPIGHKGARLTSSISLPGRFVVYVPGGSMSGISRKLSDTERSRLRTILKDVVPDEAEVIIRTAAEGAGEDELRNDVARLKAQWEVIEAKSTSGSAPVALYSEPDLTLKIVRDLFNEDFNSLIVSGDEAWDTIEPYVGHVAPTLSDRLSRWESDEDVFAHYRVDEQIAKGLDRKVHLPSGGSLVIDRTEAMTVVDVNTGKFTGGGGNLEQTVTKNNLEAAEEVARQLRLRDIGGIIVVDFIDMVLENNRDLVMRRLVECLARDRTRHQVAEVTSLGLVQMTRKRIGTGLLETFSTPCECCDGRGFATTTEPVPVPQRDSGERRGRSGGKPRKSSAKGGTKG